MVTKAHPPVLRELVQRLTKLPGIGEKSATRMAMFLLKASDDYVHGLAENLERLKREIRTCPVCFHFTDGSLCGVCADPSRQTGEICVVETSADLLAIEESGAFKGRYHVLQGALAPLDGIGPNDLRIPELLKRLEQEKVQEVILATNPTGEGEATAHYLMKLLEKVSVRVSRIASGIPMGGDVKYADKVTLERALQGRRHVQ